jgi:hypothetical protein
MSKKSRQRNKKILAAIGIGLGAAAMASRKPKQSDVSQDSVRGSGNRPTVDTAKKDTAVTTPKTIQDNKSTEPKKATASIANRSSRGAGDYPDYKAAPTRVDGTLIKGRSNAQRITPFSPAQGNRAKTTEEMLRNSDTRGYKSGGRAGYKHGGSTGSSKSSGAAKRGISPILMKGRK